jgi:hypothetical protein
MTNPWLFELHNVAKSFGGADKVLASRSESLRHAGIRRFLGGFLALTLCVAPFAGGDARAQARPTVTKNGACAPSVVSELRDNGIAVFENLPLYTTEDLDEQVATPLKFKTLVKLARGQSQFSSKDHLFVSAEIGGKLVCGWAPAALLIDNPYPLSVEEVVNEGVTPTPGKRPKNPLYMKALVKSAPQRALDFGYKFDAWLTPVYNRPPVPVAEVTGGSASVSPKDYRVADAQVFGIYYVYKVYVYRPAASGPESTPGKEQRWIYVAGSKPTDIAPVSGWINADDTYLWDTQISLYYNPKSKAPVDIYADMTALRAKDPNHRIGSRPEQDMSPPDRNIARFPVLPIGTDNLGIALNATETAYRIGFFTPFCLESGPCSTGAPYLMTDGYVRYNKRDRATEFWVSFPPDTLRNLQNTSERLCYAMADADEQQDHFESTFFMLTQAVSGDPYDPSKESINDFLERVFHIPKENFSELLNRTTADFSAWWSGRTIGGVPGATPADQERLRASVCRSVLLLNAVANNERIELSDLKLVDSRTGRWEVVNPARKPFKWQFELENGVRLYYVPMSYMPGSAE